MKTLADDLATLARLDALIEDKQGYVDHLEELIQFHGVNCVVSRRFVFDTPESRAADIARRDSQRRRLNWMKAKRDAFKEGVDAALAALPSPYSQEAQP